MNKIFTSIFLLILIAGAYLCYHYELYHLLDRQAPTITIINAPKGLNKQNAELKIKLEDNSSGLSGLSLRVFHRNKLTDLAKLSFNGEMSLEKTLPIDLSKSNISAESIELEIRVFDRSFFSNYAIKRIPLYIDYVSPQVSVVSAQHNLFPGGLEPIFYKASDKFLKESGIMQGGNFFRGFPAKLLDKKFRDPALHVAFFSINPIDRSAPIIFAKDESGNSASAKFIFNLMPRKFGKQKIKVEQDFYTRLLQATGATDKSMIQDQFTKLEQKERELLKNLANTSKSEATAIESPFLQAEGVVNFPFFEDLQFNYEEQPILHYNSPGFFFNTNHEKIILALQDGQVVYSGELPLRGKTIVINHGLGVFSVYSHLSQNLVAVDEQIKQGQEIGLPGLSGIARKLGYGLEILLSGEPANPLNWWDSEWFNDHIKNKIEEIKVYYNIPKLQ